MVIDMQRRPVDDVAAVAAFLEGTPEVQFRRCGKDEDRYRHIEGVLRRFRYARLKRADKGLVVRYLVRTTGYSRPQLVRLIKRARVGALEKGYRAPTHGFARRFTEADVALLAATDTLHGTLSGPATKHLMQRALATYGDARYDRLATISTGICTTCASAQATSSGGGSGPRPTRPRSASASAARRPRTGGRASSASTACTRAIRTG